MVVILLTFGVLLVLVSHAVFGLTAFVGATLEPLEEHLFAYSALIASGYVLQLGMLVTRKHWQGAYRGRSLLMTWICSGLLATMISGVFVHWNFPLRFEGWDGHGMGADGDEANAAFHALLHALSWWATSRWSLMSLGGER